MQKICVFIDFTDGCKIALKQASVLAQRSNATICLLNIVDAAAEATGLDKAIVKKHFATKYKDDLEKQEELVAKLRFLKGDE